MWNPARKTMVSLHILLVGIVIISTLTRDGSAMKIEIKPHKYDGVVTTSFNITCTPEVLCSCSKTILAIQVSKNDGQPLATIQQNAKIAYNPMLTANVQAEGHIAESATESKLSVMFSDALREDSGLYTCSMLYIDEMGLFQRESATQNFTVDNYNLHDFVRHLMAKISSLETTVQLALRTDSPPSGFSAGYRDNAIVIGKTLIFSEELMDIGDDYDPEIGTYTAPINGLYVFHLVVTTDTRKGSLRVNIKANEKIVATLYIEDAENRSQSSASTLVSLRAGEKVRPDLAITNYSDNDGSNNNVHSQSHLSVFTGYLLKPLHY